MGQEVQHLVADGPETAMGDTILDGNGKEQEVDLIEEWCHNCWHKGRGGNGEHNAP